jgi:hypothetical protein
VDGKKLTETIMALAAVDPVKLWEGIVSRFEEIVQNLLLRLVECPSHSNPDPAKNRSRDTLSGLVRDIRATYRSEAPPELVRLRDHPWIIHWQLDEIDLLLYRHPSRMEHYDKAER